MIKVAVLDDYQNIFKEFIDIEKYKLELDGFSSHPLEITMDNIKKFESKETGTERYMDSQNWFPETKNVKTTGSLNEMKPLGAEGVSYMSDGGNLSFGLDQWTPPSEPKKTLLQKHHERTNKFGKVTNDK